MASVDYCMSKLGLDNLTDCDLSIQFFPFKGSNKKIIGSMIFFACLLLSAIKYDAADLRKEMKGEVFEDEEIASSSSSEISTNSTTPTPTPDESGENKKIPLAIALGSFAIIIITVTIVAIILKKRQDSGKYDPDVDLGLVENEAIWFWSRYSCLQFLFFYILVLLLS